MRALLVTVIALVASACGTMQVREGFVPCMDHLRLRECIAVPLAAPSDDYEAKQFAAPTNGKARIYLMRPYADERRTKKSQVWLDGKLVAEVAPLTYVVMDVSPGAHELRVHTDDNAELSLDVKQGEIYYVQYHLDLLFFTVTGKMKMLEAKKAQQRIQQSKRAVTFAEKAYSDGEENGSPAVFSD